MKKKKKCSKLLMAMLVLVSIVFSGFSPASAAESIINNNIPEDVCKEIIQSLDFVCYEKDNYGLSGVDFDSLSVSDAIPVYEYINNKFKEMDFCLYPIVSNDELVAYAIKKNNKSSVEITTILVKETRKFYNSGDAFSIVYDKNSCYAYTTDGFILLYNSAESSSYRDVIDENNYNCFINNSIRMNQQSNKKQLDYRVNSQVDSITAISNVASAPIYYSCDVSYVSQAHNSNYCWASSVACIGNYIKGRNYSGEYVAKYLFGSDYNQATDPYTAIKTLKDIYKVTYTYYDKLPSDNSLLNSITAGYPVYGKWISDQGTHAAVISGINTISGYITVMDPSSGFVSATSDGYVYSYTSLDTGNTFSLIGYGC